MSHLTRLLMCPTWEMAPSGGASWDIQQRAGPKTIASWEEPILFEFSWDETSCKNRIKCSNTGRWSTKIFVKTLILVKIFFMMKWGLKIKDRVCLPVKNFLTLKYFLTLEKIPSIKNFLTPTLSLIFFMLKFFSEV